LWYISVVESLGTEFGEITQNKGHYAVQGHSSSLILVYDLLLVINTNLPSILHRLYDRYIWLPLLCLTPPAEGFPWDDLRKVYRGCHRMAMVP